MTCTSCFGAGRSGPGVREAPANTRQRQTHLQTSPGHPALQGPRSLWRCRSQGEGVPFSVPWPCSVRELKACQHEVICTEERRREDPNTSNFQPLLQIPCEESGQGTSTHPRVSPPRSVPRHLLRTRSATQNFTASSDPDFEPNGSSWQLTGLRQPTGHTWQPQSCYRQPSTMSAPVPDTPRTQPCHCQAAPSSWHRQQLRGTNTGHNTLCTQQSNTGQVLVTALCDPKLVLPTRGLTSHVLGGESSELGSQVC